MKRTINGFIALTLVFATLLTLTACGKKKKDEQPTEEENQDQNTNVHECSYDELHITEYPSFGKDGSLIASCECGKTSEQTISWKTSTTYATDEIEKSGMTDDEIKAIVCEYRSATFNSAEEMFQYDLAQGYLDYVTNDSYAMYVNRYTGVMYYRDELTGKMLTSNSYNFGNADIKSSSPWASQVSVTYSKVTDTTFEDTLHSSAWASERGQVEVLEIENGLRVSYAIGLTNTRCLLPVWIEAHEFEKDILRPLFDYLYDKMVENLGEQYAIDYFNGNRKVYHNTAKKLEILDEKYYYEEDVYADRYLHDSSLRNYWVDFEGMLYAYEASIGHKKIVSIETKELYALSTEIQILFEAYRPQNPNHPNFKAGDNTPQKVLDGYSMYVVHRPTYDQMADKAKILNKYCPDYTYEDMLEDEAFCGYQHNAEINPAFKIDIEYIFNDDGSFSVNLISDSIIYNDVYFILQSVELMHDYGNGKITSGEHIFLPSEA